MKNIIFYLSFSLIFSSCAENNLYGQPAVKPNKIFTDFNSYWSYHNDYVKLNRDFIALDEKQNVITKKDFFENVINNNFLPLRLKSKGLIQYQLFKVPNKISEEISRVIKQMANEDYNNFLQEGKKFPSFDFTDLKGNKYTTENTKDKILILKLWYIGCIRCVEEFPDMNKLVTRYSSNKKILFLSLAFDEKIKLENFLIKMPLLMNTVANQKLFIREVLKIPSFPTSIIIKDGIIIKRVNTVEDIDIALTKLTTIK